MYGMHASGAWSCAAPCDVDCVASCKCIRRIGQANLSGGMWTALRMPELIDLRIQCFHRLMQMVERVIALCNWTRELLVRNGVPESKITLCRQDLVAIQ